MEPVPAAPANPVSSVRAGFPACSRPPPVRRLHGLPLLALLLLLFPASTGLWGQTRSAPLALTADPRSGTVQVLLGPVLESRAIQDPIQRGLPVRVRVVTELWRDRILDAQEARHEWRASVRLDPLEGAFIVETEGGIVLSAATLAEAGRILATQLTVPLRPPGPGQYYYLGRVEVETLSRSDLEELQRWLQGDVAAAVEGRDEGGGISGALGRGLQRVVIRLLGLPTERFRARTETFRFNEDQDSGAGKGNGSAESNVSGVEPSAGPWEEASGAGVGGLTVADHRHSIHKDMVHPMGQLVGLVKGGGLADGGRIEDHQIGVEPFHHQSTVRDPDPLSHSPTGLAYRLFQGEDALIPHVSPQDPRIGPVRPRMGTPLGQGGITGTGIGAELHVGQGQLRPDILLAHGEVDHPDPGAVGEHQIHGCVHPVHPAALCQLFQREPHIAFVIGIRH